MTVRMTHARVLAFACVLFSLCALLGMTACGKTVAGGENQAANNTAAEAENQAIQDYKKSVDVAQAAALIESQREANQQQEASSEATIQEAYGKNPQSVEASPTDYSQPVTLTGIVKMKRGLNRGTNRYEDVYVLTLPESITVTGTQYGEVSGDMVILDSDYVGYAGKIVTINIRLGVCVTSSIASAEFSSIHGKEGSVEKVL